MSAIKSILLHLDASSRCAARVEVAACLARQHGAEVKGLYAVMPRALQFPLAESLSPELLQRVRAANDGRRSIARGIFDKAFASGLPNARWLEPVEDLSLRDFSRQAHYADLVVLGQREPGEEGRHGVPGDFVESVLVNSGRPVLVVPYICAQASLGQVVMVAWKETRETARAVAAAMPVLRKAERVHIATWGKEQAVERRRVADLVAYLCQHGVEAALLHDYGDEPGNIGEYMLSLAADLNADLLVMGGYGHSRVREWVLGGATRTILESMTVPVLMSH